MVSVPAHVTPSAHRVRFALTLSGYGITVSIENRSVQTAVARKADSTAIQTIEVRNAGVTEEALHTIFALTLAGEGITELVQRTPWVAATGNTAVRIRAIEEFEAVVTSVTC